MTNIINTANTSTNTMNTNTMNTTSTSTNTMNTNTNITNNTDSKTLGIKIAVVDNGFIYVGDVIVTDVYYIITRCANVRKSGTERGLGQIAFGGPTKETVLDYSPNVLVPIARMCHLMDVAEDKWVSHLR